MMAGTLVHFELPAADVGRAKGFWSGVFGWEFGDSAMPDVEYYTVRTGEGQGGAVMPSDGPFGIVVYFDTDDIDASLAAVCARRNGGREAADPARRLVHALYRYRGERVQPLPERRVGHGVAPVSLRPGRDAGARPRDRRLRGHRHRYDPAL
jgi:predicted enzyme related to lactoylglutathione lyase